MFLIDAHQDIAYNILNFGRDYLRSAEETRRIEAETGSETPTHNGNTLLGWPDYQQAGVGVIFSTLYASPFRRRMGEWNKLFYRDMHEAHRRYMDQVDAYHRLVDENPDYFRLIQTQGDLSEVVAPWQAGEPGDKPVGLVILMECADGVREPAELEAWYARGVRIIGPAWAGTRFCGGTGEPGPLTSEGYALLDGMASFGFVLDISHMDAQAALQALDHYEGRVIASHANALSLIKGSESNRHLPDRVIQSLLERGGVIGIVPYSSFLKHGWRRGHDRGEVTLEHVTAQIDYICQMAGDPYHVGIGSDFDGGFGVESAPEGVDTIVDLNKLAPLLADKGYSEADVAAIMGGNWLHLLEQTLPETV